MTSSLPPSARVDNESLPLYYGELASSTSPAAPKGKTSNGYEVTDPRTREANANWKIQSAVCTRDRVLKGIATGALIALGLAIGAGAFTGAVFAGKKIDPGLGVLIGMVALPTTIFAPIGLGAIGTECFDWRDYSDSIEANHRSIELSGQKFDLGDYQFVHNGLPDFSNDVRYGFIAKEAITRLKALHRQLGKNREVLTDWYNRDSQNISYAQHTPTLLETANYAYLKDYFAAQEVQVGIVKKMNEHWVQNIVPHLPHPKVLEVSAE